ncbi:MAG: two component, sigma54 specific, transcriptional regulator, Fis family [Planctomycetaceae bacterium]|nr:two component, sigma54 specific, transcriptional regulator, Fis family [Planctomycetaceae bacterium]
MAAGKPLTVDDLPASIVGRNRKSAKSSTGSFTRIDGAKTLREIEMDVIHQCLEKHQGDKPKVAQELGISLKTLYNKLNQNTNSAAAS